MLLAAMAACGGTTTESEQQGRALTTIKVGIMTIPDCATVPVAQQRKYFEAEGLRVETVTVQGGGIALPMLKSGALHFSIMNHVAAIQDEAREPGTIKLVTDAYQAAPGAFVLMVPKDSPIDTVGDLRGKHVSVLTLNSVGTLTLDAALKVHGLTNKDVQVSEMKVTDMINALESKRIDAAWMTEPFITAFAIRGGRKIADMMQGQTADLPIAGWATSGDFAKNNPGTVRAFQRAMLRAQNDVADDRQLVTDILPTYTKIDKQAAANIVLGTFPVGLARSRLQRVVDLMVEYGYIQNGAVNVDNLLISEPAASLSPLDQTQQEPR
ncbi:ABC transporter substrate-binding protein [Nonomuraea salmonea]|uniref:ABC transporter substrate-binding protein n=1 Tax=Nonomuraea salmonea TaxID=46181 RepID=UPI0031EBED7A